ncbi:inner-membrane translocator [Rubrobacter xylanophilus DSM 9941]|uniref:Inner-membrane translocator n=1 Tax=Rubrobacter xylanophilus (strain DSM 9941 / JCM 11954 / NBRC 16129 / PRD-1) TaxID=266117 RepID=Q1AZ40_RUBXD|nr:inner-membrane translocator [Rubrobacter xylanophilus DSM 9941]
MLVQALVTGLLLGGVYSLVSMGLTLIFGVLDILNFAHGAFMALAMYASFVLVANAGFDPYLSLLVSVPLLFVLGVLVQRVLLARVMDQPHENQLLLTFGLALLIENALLMVFTATPRTVEFPYAQTGIPLGFATVRGPLDVFGAVADLPRVIAFLGSLVIAGGLFYLLRRTSLGTAIRAVAENPDGAAMVGIDVRRMHMIAFGLGTACVAAAGTLVLPFLSLQPTTGEQFNVIAFVVVVLGGLGNVVGALVGGILIGLVQELGGAFVPGVDKLFFVFVVFVLTLLLRPQGLFGGKP